jgi:hypothetical protein
VLIGDSGSRPRDPVAHGVAEAAGAHCARLAGGCDGIVLLGDNFYRMGLLGLRRPDGRAMRRQIEDRFPALPLYAVLGNHEYTFPPFAHPLAMVRYSLGWEGVGVERGPQGPTLRRADEDSGSTLVIPHRYYALQDSQSGVQLLFLDTTPLHKGRGEDQLAWMAQLCDEPAWRVAFGHHPISSFGKYTGGLPLGQEGLEGLADCAVRFYAAGHDHGLQEIELRLGEHPLIGHAVSGKGGAVRDRIQGEAYRPAPAGAFQPVGSTGLTAILRRSSAAIPDPYGGYMILELDPVEHSTALESWVVVQGQVRQLD